MQKKSHHHKASFKMHKTFEKIYQILQRHKYRFISKISLMFGVLRSFPFEYPVVPINGSTH